MILLSSMSALFGEQVSDVEYGAEAVIPFTDLSEFTAHHESIYMLELQENISQVGGSTVGELVLLDTEDEYV